MTLKIKHLRRCCWLLMVALAITGCSREKSPEKPQPKPVAQEAAPAKAASQQPLQVHLLPAEASAGTCLQAVVTGGGKVTYVWSRNDTVLDQEHGSRLCTDDDRRDDRIDLVVTTSDGRQGHASLTLGNSLPTVVKVESEPKLFYRGVDVTVTPTGEDKDGDILTYKYQWLINGEANPVNDGPTLEGDRFSKGDRIVIVITANDGYGDGPAFRSRQIVVPDAPPKFVSAPPENLPLPEFSYQLQATDPDDDPLHFALLEGPEGMKVDADSGLLSWKVPAKLTGSIPVKVQVLDPDGASSTQSFTLSLGGKQEQKQETSTGS